tara:strand:- start:258 stop:458 length:201 start_codon:yes stop_codon:yes gene_type:complete
MEKLKKGDLVTASFTPAIGIYLGVFTSINRKTGEPYHCAEIMWLETNHISTASFSVLERVENYEGR